jgi:hypothetical protein
VARTGRLTTMLAVATTVGIGLAACSSSSGGSSSGGGAPRGGGTTAAINPVLTTPGPDHGWNQTNVPTPTVASLACNGKAPNPTRGVTATSIKIGGLATLTSPAGASFASPAGKLTL